MTAETIVKLELEYGDTITLHSWEELSKMCSPELDYYKENGNLVCPNGYRLFVKEKDLYGKTYKVKSVRTSEFYPEHIIINCMGKGEISPFEVKSVIKSSE